MRRGRSNIGSTFHGEFRPWARTHPRPRRKASGHSDIRLCRAQPRNRSIPGIRFGSERCSPAAAAASSISSKEVTSKSSLATKLSSEFYWVLVHDLGIERMSTHDFIFPRSWEWDKGEQARVLRAFCIGNRLPSVRFHALRACFATQLISTGIPATVVMKICG